MQPMTLSYKMLLLVLMSELANAEGRVTLRLLAERFQEFFVARSVQPKKMEENPNRVRSGVLSSRSRQEWEIVIRQQPVRYLGESFVIDEGTSVKWAPRIWNQW